MDHLFLYGPPASGKSTYARMLAERLDLRVVDLDQQIAETAGKSIPEIFAQEGEADARRQWRAVADQLRERFAKVGALMDEAEADVLAHMTFPKAHRLQIHSTNPLERLNAEIKRRTDVVGIFPNEAAIVRLVGAILLEQNDEWQLQRRYLQLEGLQALGDNQPARLSAVMS